MYMHALMKQKKTKMTVYTVRDLSVFVPIVNNRSFYSQLKRAVEPRKMPGHYKKILLAQQPIRVRVLL